jgi:AcrR family transcriptional regulator
MAGPEYRERLKADTIAIARRILATEGLAALQARRIAKEAGCSVGTIYNLYANLDDLIVVANAGTLEDLGRALAGEVNATVGEPFARRLVSVGLTYLRFAIEQENAWRAIFEHHMPKDETVPEWYRERQGELFAIVERLLASEMRDACERAKTARALFAAVHGIVALALDQKLGTFDREGTEDQIRFVVGAAATAIRAG